jgi:hypothetical protein
MKFSARISRGLFAAATGCLLTASAAAQEYTSLVREQKAVLVGGVRETWRLQWDAPPLPACGPEDLEVALGCQCTGFAYGEAGKPTLMRLRRGHAPERLELAPFFKGQGAPGGAGMAVLQRWRPKPAAAHDEDDDWHHAADFDFMKRVQARGEADLLRFGDYTHDGRASEFLLQVGLRPCGRPQLVLVGVSRFNPRLHVFAAAEAPAEPLVLPAEAWAALRKGTKPVQTVESSCADPGSEVESTLTVSVQRGVFHLQRESKSCPRPSGDGEANSGNRH